MAAFAVPILVAAFTLSGARAADPGDLVVTNFVASRLVVVDPVDGSQEVLSEGGLLEFPWDLAFDTDGRILVADRLASGGSVVRVHPRTGNQELLASGGFFATGEVVSIVMTPERELFVSISDINTETNVVRIDPDTGAQTLVTPAPIPQDARGAAVAADGSLWFVHRVGHEEVLSVDPDSGAVTSVTAGDLLVNPFDMAIDADGFAYVSDLEAFGGASGIVGIDPDTGGQVEITSGDLLAAPWGIGLEASGQLVIVNALPLEILRVDPADGSQTVISSLGFLGSPTSVAAVPPRIPACRDFIDNDGDGRTDHPDDPGCSGPDDPREKSGGCGLGWELAPVLWLLRPRRRTG